VSHFIEALLALWPLIAVVAVLCAVAIILDL
jgi:hypothetical protein